MPTTDEKHMALARVYCDALLSLAAARGEEDEVWESLAGMARAIEEQPDFELFLDSPLVDDAEKQAFLERLLRGRTPDLLVDGLQVVRRKGRLGLAGDDPAARQDHRGPGPTARHHGRRPSAHAHDRPRRPPPPRLLSASTGYRRTKRTASAAAVPPSAHACPEVVST